MQIAAKVIYYQVQRVDGALTALVRNHQEPEFHMLSHLVIKLTIACHKYLHFKTNRTFNLTLLAFPDRLNRYLHPRAPLNPMHLVK